MAPTTPFSSARHFARRMRPRRIRHENAVARAKNSASTQSAPSSVAISLLTFIVSSVSRAPTNFYESPRRPCVPLRPVAPVCGSCVIHCVPRSVCPPFGHGRDQCSFRENEYFLRFWSLLRLTECVIDWFAFGHTHTRTRVI